MEEKVRSGRYATASDVVCEALLLLDRRDRAYQEKRDALLQKLREGEEAIARGELIPADEVIARQREKLLERREQARQANLEALRSEVDIARAQIDRGEITPGKEAMARLRAERRKAAS